MNYVLYVLIGCAPALVFLAYWKWLAYLRAVRHRQYAEFLYRWAKVVGIQPRKGEPLDDLRGRIISVFVGAGFPRGPS